MSHASTILPLHGPASCRAASGHASKAGRGARVVLLMPAATDTRVFQRAFGACATLPLYPRPGEVWRPA
jgi:hypothetical protein